MIFFLLRSVNSSSPVFLCEDLKITNKGERMHEKVNRSPVLQQPHGYQPGKNPCMRRTGLDKKKNRGDVVV